MFCINTAARRFGLAALLSALIAGCGPSANTASAIWTDTELAILRSLSLDSLEDLPESPSNRFADHSEAASLGKKIFFDKQFSFEQQLSCASCHVPELAFTDGLPRAKGVHATGRNTPSVIGAAWQQWFYWDGRKDSLWSQALVPFESADEMGSSRLEVLRVIGSDKHYKALYESVFGRFPPQILNPTLPKKAGPLGDAQTRENWYRLPPALQKLINRSYANIGKAIAAYERTLSHKPTPFDEYVSALTEDDLPATLSDDAIAGAKLFIDQETTQCLRCHNGPLQTNHGFHNIDSGNFDGDQLDFGRMLGLNAVLLDEFNCLGPYSDAKPEQCTQLRFLNRDTHNLKGAFKVPTLRGLTHTAPYFHDGRYATLEQVIEHYQQHAADGGEIPAIELTETQVHQLVAFLGSLSNVR